MNSPKNPLEQALDILLFAPVGLVLTARDELPEVVERGRQAIVGRLTMARMVGQFAATMSRQEAEKRLHTALEQAEAFVSAKRPPVPTTTLVREEPSAAVPPEAVPPVVRSVPTTVRPVSGDDDVVPLASDLAIPGYDTLSASQVVRRLDSLTPAELERVCAYEVARRARKTILQRVAQLQSEGAA